VQRDWTHRQFETHSYFYQFDRTEQRQTVTLDLAEDQLFYRMSKLVQFSSSNDDVQVTSLSENGLYKQHGSLNESLSAFIQVTPSDEQLL
jgi:hypothetical protein